MFENTILKLNNSKEINSRYVSTDSNQIHYENLQDLEPYRYASLQNHKQI
jgi:hypothetical protein